LPIFENHRIDFGLSESPVLSHVTARSSAITGIGFDIGNQLVEVDGLGWLILPSA